ncbi:MAG: radical SAM protein [Desulfobacteraceae bacterium]|nr:radical SAM protein [Desulfobacteraceae bacterium]
MKTLLVQLPIPKLNSGLKTGNVPLGAACLKIAVPEIYHDKIEILPESIISYLGDSSAIDLILSKKPDIVFFSLFCWNVKRSIYIAEKLKKNNIRVAFGGPEASPDNRLVLDSCADFVVFGEGESFFKKFICPEIFNKEDSDDCLLFKNLSSPYVKGMLEPKIQDSILVETQRGCPYSCGYCYYSKSRSKICVRPARKVYEAVEYAISEQISEVYFLDPSLNSRPELKKFLNDLSIINRERQTVFHSEIRAESITPELADLFYNSGFKSFEIGLQSVNPFALSVMKRPTDLSKFLKGVNLLKERDISPCIDLITGLPGDNPSGIKSSIDFIVENGLEDDVQFFPLSVIPGTDFRLNYKKLGLDFNPEPPYNIISTPGFTKEELLMSFEYAEDMLGISFFPMPDIDLSFKSGNNRDIRVKLGNIEYISRLVLLEKRDLSEIEFLAGKMASPYQIFFGDKITEREYVLKVVEILSSKNPFTSFEVIFYEPQFRPSQKEILSACRLERPHFLDGDLRYLYPEEGNRAVLFTVASCEKYYNFRGPMEREVFIWKRNVLPDLDYLYSMDDYDGILIDTDLADHEIEKWQDQIEENFSDLIHITFADLNHQKRWIKKNMADTYNFYFYDSVF